MRILINRSDAIGDTALTLPMIENIKKNFPKAVVALAISARTKDYLELYQTVDYLFVVDQKLKFFQRLARWKDICFQFMPTHYFFVGGDRLGNLAAWLKRIPIRGGLISKLSSFLFLNAGIRQSRSESGKHESVLNIELLSPLKGKDQSFVAPELIVSQQSQKEFESYFKDEFLRGASFERVMVVHPGMTGHSPNWPMSCYLKLIDLVSKEMDITWVISYTPGDQKYIDELKEIQNREFPHLDLNFYDGSLRGLKDYCALLKLADGFIGPSTGTTHLAGLCGLPVWAFYSPFKAQSALRWGPISRDEEKIHLFSPQRDRQKHAKSPKNAYDGMKEIMPEVVFQSIIDYF